MKDEFANRQSMHGTVLHFLDENKSVWENKPPVIFTEKVAKFRAMVADLHDTLLHQGAILVGIAERKEREEDELEVIAHELGQSLGDYFTDTDQEDLAAKVDHSLSDWQEMRDETLSTTAKLLLDQLTTAIEADPETLAKYDLTPQDTQNLTKELADFDEIISGPSSGIAGRKARTLALRPKFRAAATLLRSMDKNVLRFRKTPVGQQFAENWQTARVIRDLGSRADSDEPTSAPPA